MNDVVTNKRALVIVLLAAVIPYVGTLVALLMFKGDLSVAAYQADPDRFDDALRQVHIYLGVGCIASGVGFIVGMYFLTGGRFLVAVLVALLLITSNILLTMFFFWIMYVSIGGRL